MPKRYLIGPRLYPLFLLVTQIVVTVLFFVFLGLMVVSLYRTGLSATEFLSTVSKFALSFVTGSITALGYIVLAFAVIDRSMSAQDVAAELEEERTAWDPQSLARAPDPDVAKPSESIIAILFLLLGLALFNLYPQWVGLWWLVDGEWMHVPMLAPAFFTYLPWINLLILLEIGLHLVLLRRGRWGVGTRLANIVLNLAGILLAAAMLTGPTLIELNPASFAGTSLADVTQTLSWIIGWMPDMVLVILIVVQGVEIVQDALRLIRGKATSA
jgi:hypothetical protein